MTSARRRGSRGAAMAEGIIVLTTLVTFLGVIVFGQKAYGTKLDQLASTRRDALAFASLGCTGGTPLGVPGVQPDGTTSRVADFLQGTFGTSTVIQQSWNTFDASAATSVTAQAIVNERAESGIDLRKVPLSAAIATRSSVGCNERYHGNPWTAIFEFGWENFARLFGLGFG